MPNDTPTLDDPVAEEFWKTHDPVKEVALGLAVRYAESRAVIGSEDIVKVAKAFEEYLTGTEKP